MGARAYYSADGYQLVLPEIRPPPLFLGKPPAFPINDPNGNAPAVSLAVPDREGEGVEAIAPCLINAVE